MRGCVRNRTKAERKEEKMGVVVEINSLEEMCDLMCDNRLPKEKKKWWYFTFGQGQQHQGHYVRIHGTYNEARRKMFEKYGEEWAFQYSEEVWKEMEEDPWRDYPMETELEVIE